MNWLLQELPWRVLGRPSVGLLEPDRALGWRNRPHARALHPTLEFLVRYDADGSGRRIVPGSTTKPAPLVLLGCSWTFGHGVAGPATFAAGISEHLGWPIVNLAVMGYGPVQALLMTRSGDVRAAAADMAVVLYVWIPEQLIRCWRRRRWLAMMSDVLREPALTHPVLDVVDGALVDAGVIGVADGVADVFDPLHLLSKVEMAVTALALREIDRTCRANGLRFAVVVPMLRHLDVSDASGTAELKRLLARHDVEVWDLDGAHTNATQQREQLFFRFDGHPRESWHRATATQLAERWPE